MSEIAKYQAYERLSSDAHTLGGLIERTMKVDADLVQNEAMVRTLLEVQHLLMRVHLWAETHKITDRAALMSASPLAIEDIRFE